MKFLDLYTDIGTCTKSTQKLMRMQNVPKKSSPEIIVQSEVQISLFYEATDFYLLIPMVRHFNP